MDKVKKEGTNLVAVLVSHGFGAGWFTWNIGIPECLTDPAIVRLVLDGAPTERIEAAAEANWPKGYWGGASGLQVHWVPEGSQYRISEYDGAEGIHLASEEAWQVA